MKIITKLNSFFESRKSAGIFLLRVFVGLRLIYGVVDNILSWEKMLEFSVFLENSNVPFPIVSAVISVYVQFLGAILLIVGYMTRLAAFFLTINFLVAVSVHIGFNDSVEGMTPALAILFCCIALIFTGPGKIAVRSNLV